jgi:hypothetical protein
MADIVTEMMNSLVAAGHASATGTDLFAMHIRPEPDTQLVVIPTGGELPLMTIDSAHELPGVQVYVVGSDLSAVWGKAIDIYNYYKILRNVIRQDIKAARSSPIYLGKLEDGRHKVVVEFKIF